MNQKILNQPILISSDQEESENSSFLRSFIPVGLAVFGSIAFLIIRIYAGGTNFISDGALMMLALACYLTAAVFYLTNLYAPSSVAERLGMWGAGLGNGVKLRIKAILSTSYSIISGVRNFDERQLLTISCGRITFPIQHLVLLHFRESFISLVYHCA